MNAPAVAAITLHPTGGGVAAVSRLLWQAVRRTWGSQAQLLTMFDHESRPATLIEKARFTTSLARLQSFDGADFVLCTHLSAALAQNALPYRLRRPYAVFLHGIEAWNGLSAAAQRALAGASARLSNSHYTADRIRRAHPEIGSIDVCPLALPDRLDEGSPVVDSRRRNVVLVVGRLLAAERYKGHDQLIDAWPAVIEAAPDAELVIVGTGDDEARLKAKAEARGVGGCVRFPGFVSDAELHALYECAAVFALPSKGEGFGLVYLEAMSHGLPCIGSTHDAAGEIIVDGETGMLVDQDDVRALGAAIATLVRDERRRKAMGSAGRARARTEFTFDRFCNRLTDILSSREQADVAEVEALG